MNETMVAVEVSLSQTDTSYDEKQLVERWSRTLKAARDCDKVFRRVVLRDRAFCDGKALTGYAVSTNLVQAMIDTLIPFLYAKDPDVDCTPHDQTDPPYSPRLKKPDMPMPMPSPDGPPIMPPPEAIMAYDQQMQAWEAAQQEDYQRQEERRKEQDYIRRLSQTLRIVISRSWGKAGLKREARKMVRSGLSVGEGWLKVAMHGDVMVDTTVQEQLYTIRQQAEQVEALQRTIDEGQSQNVEADLAALRAKIEGLEARVETYIGRCLVIDWVDTLDMQAPSSIRNMEEYTSAPWLADSTYYSMDEAEAEFDLPREKLAKASKWKPEDESAENWQLFNTEWQEWTNDADGERWTKTTADDANGMVRCWEIWSRKDNMIYTWIEGMDCWAKAPRPPRLATTRFYPYFLYSPYMVDGSRHGQSLSWRLSKLQTEYATTRSNFSEVRRRAKPGVIFDKTNLSKEDVSAIINSEEQEYVGISPIRPENLAGSFAPKPYADVNPGLYDTQPIRSDMETIAGVQEALSQGITTAKTATEAEIQQTGTSARTGFVREALDDLLTDLAMYTAELALGGFTEQKVRMWAGSDAVWPQGIEIEKLEAIVGVKIRAGSTGKPNTSAERASWSTAMPMLQSLILQIGQMRGADNVELADRLEELARETMRRLGDNLDVDRFIPGAAPGAQAQMQQPPMGGMPEQMGGAPSPMPQPTPPTEGMTSA